jgi:hypothetical protein
VLAQRGDDDLARQLEVTLVERAGDRGGPLDQIVDDVHQLVVGHDAAGLLARRRDDLLAHRAPPFRGVGQHLRLAQRLQVAPGLLHVECRRVEEAVAVRAAAGFEPERLHRHDFLPEQREQPADGPPEAIVAVVPAHGLRELELHRHLAECRRQHLERGLPLVVHGDGHVFALRRGDLAHGRGLDALAGAEAEQRARRAAVGVERNARRGAHRFLVEVGLSLGEPVHEHGEPARRAVRDHAAEREPQALESFAHATLQLLQRRRRVARGQLLDADLEQQLARAHRRAPASAGAGSAGFAPAPSFAGFAFPAALPAASSRHASQRARSASSLMSG